MTDLEPLLFRARDGLLLELRRRAYDRLPEPSPLLLEIDTALGIKDHTWYFDPGGLVADAVEPGQCLRHGYVIERCCALFEGKR